MSLESIFKPEALSAREQITEWVNVKAKLGTQVGGKFLGYFAVPAKDQFKAQVGVALQDLDDPKKVYGVNLPEYLSDSISEYQVGDEVGFEYYKDTPAKKPGLSPTKSLRAYNEALKKRKESGSVTKSAPEIRPAEDHDEFDDFDLPAHD